MIRPKDKKQPTLSALETSLFFRELSLLFGSGISLSEALYIMADNADNDDDQRLCRDMAVSVDSGKSLPDAAKDAGVFPAYVVQMLSIAQTSGKLDETISGLAVYYERLDSLRKAVRSTLTFPLVMLAVMFCVLSVLIVKVLPLFGAVFAETGAETPLIIRLVTGSSAFEICLIAVLIILFGLVAAAFVMAGRTLTSYNDDSKLIGRLPVIRSIGRQAQAGSFAYSMALLLSGGVTVEQALHFVSENGESSWIRSRSAQILDSVNKGSSFALAVSECGVFEGYYPALLAAGEKSGETDKVMNLISDRYTEDMDEKISSVLGLVEPVLVIAMSVIVGAILLSIMIPLMNVMTGV